MVVSSAPVRSLVPPLAMWDVDIGPADLLFAKLADDDVIPNTSGLAGAKAMTKAEVASMMGNIASVQVFHTEEHLGNMAKAAGAVNILK